MMKSDSIGVSTIEFVNWTFTELRLEYALALQMVR